jgi:hypothetical protein
LPGVRPGLWVTEAVAGVLFIRGTATVVLRTATAINGAAARVRRRARVRVDIGFSALSVTGLRACAVLDL